MAADIFFSMIKHQCFFLARGDSSFLALRRVKGKKITRMSHLAFYCSLLLADLDIHSQTMMEPHCMENYNSKANHARKPQPILVAKECPFCNFSYFVFARNFLRDIVQFSFALFLVSGDKFLEVLWYLTKGA